MPQGLSLRHLTSILFRIASRCVQVSVGHAGKTTACACQPNDASIVATADTSGQVFLWDLASARSIQRVGLHGAATCMRWSASGSLLAVAAGAAGEAEGPFLAVFRHADRRLEVLCKIPNVAKDHISGLCFSNSQSHLYLLTSAGQVLVYDAGKWRHHPNTMQPGVSRRTCFATYWGTWNRNLGAELSQL